MLPCGGLIRMRKTYGLRPWIMQFTYTTIPLDRIQDSAPRNSGPDPLLVTLHSLMPEFGDALHMSWTRAYRMVRRFQSGNLVRAVANMLVHPRCMQALWV